MSKPYDLKFLFFVVLLFFSVMTITTLPSCKTSGKTVKIKEEKKTEDKSAPDLQSLIEQHSFTANSMSAKASVRYKTATGDNTEFNINMRMLKDSAIWISISPLLGIEVARVMLTPDSVMYMDRMNNKYALNNYNYLNRMFDVNVDFEIIQGILTGNLFAYKKNKFNSVYLEDQYYILSTLSKKKLQRSLEDIDINRPVVQDMYIDPSTYRIIRLQIEDHRSGKMLQTSYSDHRETITGLFPHRLVTIVKAGEQVDVDIQYQKLNINETVTFPFKIPSGYAKMD